MEAIILAAGHATRLYPLTIDRPKPLLKVNNKAILTHIIEHLEASPDIKKINIITNKKFEQEFENWLSTIKSSKPIKIISNHIVNPNEKFSAIDNLKLVMDTENIKDDCLVVAGDGLFNFNVNNLIKNFKEKNKSTLLLFDTKDEKKTTPYNNVILDAEGHVVEMIEKPKEPKTSLISICYYALKKEDLDKIENYLKETPNLDAPGHFIQWLHKKTKMSTYEVENIWFDIGNAKDLLNANKSFMDRSVITEDNVHLTNSKIRGKVHIFNGSKLENSDVEDCIIFENTMIKNCKLKNCIIDKNTNISNLNLEDSVIGPNTNLNHISESELE